jgi:hypothetical protein
MITRLDTQEWLRIIAESASEVATVALGLDACEIRTQGSLVPEGLIGAYLPLGTNEQPMQVGFLSNPVGCQRLAKALLGMGAEEEDLTPADLSDAISELANVVAGGIKRRVPGGVEIKLGLPLFVNGSVQPNEHLVIMTAELQLGLVQAWILFATPRNSVVTHLSSATLAAVRAGA